MSISRAYAEDVVNLLLASDNLILRGVDAAAIGDCSRSAYAQHVAKHRGSTNLRQGADCECDDEAGNIRLYLCRAYAQLTLG